MMTSLIVTRNKIFVMHVNLSHLVFKIPCFKKQQGFVAILILVVVSLTAVGFIFNLMNLSSFKEMHVNKTGQALVQAKEALIGFSVGNASMPGALPCPDTNNDGISDPCSAGTSIGRLPWKTLGMSDIRDADGECLWYALSPVFRNTLSVSTRGNTQPALNSATAGSITVFNEQGVALPVPVNKVIALIIAPSISLSSQSRTNLGSTVCGGNNTASNYLDSSNGINNATGNRVGNNLSFIMGKLGSSFNDQLIYITQEDLYKPLRKRIAKEIMGNFGVIKGLSKYYQVNTQYPCPATTVTGIQYCPASGGYIPYSDPQMQYPSLGTWLIKNGWFGLTNYYHSNSTPTQSSFSVGVFSLTSTCTANNASVTCN